MIGLRSVADQPLHPAPGATGSVADTERTYSYLFDVSPFPAVVSRLDNHTVLAVNARTAEVIGVAQADAAGLSVASYYVNPSERAEFVERLRRDGRTDGVRAEIKRANGEPFWALASSRLISWRGTPAALTVFFDITAQVAAEALLHAGERRLVAQSDALTALTAHYADPTERLDDRLRRILAISAAALDVERLSMWRLDASCSRITCEGLYRRTEEAYETGAVLLRDDAPAYFSAVEGERVIAASDAQADPRTSAFRDSYLVPNRIGAMLDVPLRHRNRTVGVLCAEHVGPPRIWTVDEQNFAISVANLIAATTAEDERERAVSRLAESDARAQLIIDTAHDAFVGIGSEGLVVEWNAQAEHTFGWTRQEILGRNCRFMPSCSDYAIEAVTRHGPVRGTWLAMKRIGRCHPWNAGGYDPPPERKGIPGGT
jgi:putative membrane protein insertion efficiency factor